MEKVVQRNVSHLLIPSCRPTFFGSTVSLSPTVGGEDLKLLQVESKGLPPVLNVLAGQAGGPECSELMSDCAVMSALLFIP